MGRTEAAQLAQAAALTALAGWVDAVGFLRLDGLYVSFMSGNTTRMGVSFGGGQVMEGLAAAALALLFVMGVFAGRLMVGAPRGRRTVMTLVSVLLLLALVMTHLLGRAGGVMATAAMVLAMGAQNTVLSHVGAAKASLTYVTGTLVALGHALADAAAGQGRPGAALPYFGMWLGLGVGAFAGGWSYGHAGALALLVPAAAAALLALALGGLVRPATPPGSSS